MRTMAERFGALESVRRIPRVLLPALSILALLAAPVAAETGLAVSGSVGLGIGAEKDATGVDPQISFRLLHRGGVGIGVEAVSGYPKEVSLVCSDLCPRRTRRLQYSSVMLMTQDRGMPYGIVSAGLYDDVERTSRAATFDPEIHHNLSFGGSVGLGIAARGRVSPTGEIRLHLVGTGEKGSGAEILETLLVTSFGLLVRF